MGVVTMQNTESQVPKGYKKTDVGVIPVDWEVKELSSIGRVVSGKRLPKGWLVQDMENPHPYLRVTDMFMGGVDSFKWIMVIFSVPLLFIYLLLIISIIKNVYTIKKS